MERLELLQQMLPDLLGGALPAESLHVVSATTGTGLEGLRQALFQSLRVVRVYTKMPGSKPDLEKPFVVSHGATVMELAEIIHRDMLAHFKFARVWGSGRFEGQTVQRDHVLEDRDVIEIHA
jgi:ribosome-interacting GTPase 1